MINYNKIEEKEFVFVNKPHSDKEDKAFSDFLKRRKTKVKSKKKNTITYQAITTKRWPTPN